MKTNLDELREKAEHDSNYGGQEEGAYYQGILHSVEAIEKDVMKLPFFLKSHYKEGDLEFIKRDEIKQLFKVKNG